MNSAVADQARNRAPAGPGTPAVPGDGGWVVSPAFDLIFLANVAWPLLFLVGVAGRSETNIDFWQVYFLTLPHRWITLALVAADPDRRGGRGLMLAGIALVLLLVVVGVRFGTAGFTCLAALDYAWNAWHFAAQHAGVLRIYARKVGGGPEWLERHALRAFVTYTILRTAAWLTGWLEVDAPGRAIVRAVDLAMLIVPILLVGVTLASCDRRRIGKMAYVLSVCVLYAGLLASLAFRWPRGVLVLATASGLFHAVEYLAIVTHYAWRRREIGRAGAFRRVANVWGPLLAIYAVLLGTTGAWLEGPSSPAAGLWQGANLWAALVHYAFDGLIWKLRRPETAQALGIGGGRP